MPRGPSWSAGTPCACPTHAAFDITFCHFLLLWVQHPLQALSEMQRVTRPGGFVLALAEPDYDHRLDTPASLTLLGRWQAESLRRQGADPGIGARLADLFRQTGLQIVEDWQPASRRHACAFTHPA